MAGIHVWGWECQLAAPIDGSLRVDRFGGRARKQKHLGSLRTVVRRFCDLALQNEQLRRLYACLHNAGDKRATQIGELAIGKGTGEDLLGRSARVLLRTPIVRQVGDGAARAESCMQDSGSLETDVVGAATNKNCHGVARCQCAHDLAIELSDCSRHLLLPRRVEPVAAKLKFGNGLPYGTVEVDRVVSAFLSGHQLRLAE